MERHRDDVLPPLLDVWERDVTKEPRRLRVENCGEVGLLVESHAALVDCAVQLANLLSQAYQRGDAHHLVAAIAHLQGDLAKVGHEFSQRLATVEDPNNHMECPLPSAVMMVTESKMVAVTRLMVQISASKVVEKLWGGIFFGGDS